MEVAQSIREHMETAIENQVRIFKLPCVVSQKMTQISVKISKIQIPLSSFNLLMC